MIIALVVGLAWAQDVLPVVAPAAALPAAVVPAPVADVPPPVGAVVVDRVAAVVNDEVILLSEVYAFADYLKLIAPLSAR